MLEHSPHALHVVTRETPIALAHEVPQLEHFLLPVLDTGQRQSTLVGNELLAALRLLAIEIEVDARGGENAEGLAIVDHDLMALEFVDSVR